MEEVHRTLGRLTPYRAGNGEGGRMRSIRVPDELWEETGEAAREANISRSEVVRQALRNTLGLEHAGA